MAIDYQRLRAWTFDDRVDRYTARDCMIYALGLGYGGDPLDEAELRYVHEQDTAVAPTFLATVGAPNGWAADPATGIDWLRILHGEHRMAFHALPAQAEVRSRTRVTRVVDKGAGKGALVVTAREISDAGSGQPLATVEHVSFCRADGGFGAGDEPPPALPAPPERAPDESVLLPTLPQQALLYRLNGDLNPVHAVPRMAREAASTGPSCMGCAPMAWPAARWRGPAARAASAWPASPRAFPRRSFPAKRCAWTSGATAGGCSSAPGRRSAAWRC